MCLRCITVTAAGQLVPAPLFSFSKTYRNTAEQPDAWRRADGAWAVAGRVQALAECAAAMGDMGYVRQGSRCGGGWGARELCGGSESVDDS